MQKKPRFSFLGLVVAFGVFFSGCGAANDLVDIVFDKPSRKTINKDLVGVTNFFTDAEYFGNIDTQFRDIKGTLGLHYVRILVPWLDGTQPSPNAPLNFGFSDGILSRIPAGVDVLIVLAHTPSWMSEPGNWVDGNPRKTFVEKFLKPVVARYAGRRGIVGWEIFNEPDDVSVASDASLDLSQPQNYLELLQLSHAAIRKLDPSRLVVMAATRSINQDWPNRLRYNQRLKDLGAANFTDVWNVHYYGEQYEKVEVNDGIADLLTGIGKPVWVTESGEQGVNNQLAYVETAWPYLKEKIPQIERFYYYQYASTAQPLQNFGLRTADPSASVSDLYVWLRDH